jgi:hypothetical protein
MLRWYPRAWRERYGDEFIAMLEDTVGNEAPRLSTRASVAASGLRERGYEAGLVGEGQPAGDQVRAGALLVLGAWVAMVVAGMSLAKTSEHFARAMPQGARPAAQLAYDLVAAAGALGSALVVVGAVIALPSLLKFLRAGGAPVIRASFLRAMAALLLTVVATFALAGWAHHLSTLQRNGADATYSGTFVGFALLVVTTLVLWMVTIVKVARRLQLSDRALRWESRLAVAVMGSMVAITIGAVVWWSEVAANTSWFRQGPTTAIAVSPMTLKLALTCSLMCAASVVALHGVRRIVAVRRRAS